MLEVGIQSAYWYSEKDPDASFRYIRECGFQTVDFNIDTKLPGDAIKTGVMTPFYDQSIEELKEFYRPMKEAAEKNGITFSQMHAPFPLSMENNETVNSYMIMVVEKICAICAYVGCPALVVHPVSRADKEAEKKENLTMYRAMIPAAKQYGVKLCLENLFASYKGRLIEGACSAVEEACWYIDTLNAEAGAEVFGFCLDVGHANILGRNLRQYINKLGKRLTILHIHDNDANADLHMIPYTYTRNWGKDLICDWEGFILGLKDIGYEGTLCFETFRGLGAFPRDLWTDALKLISAIGKYFAKRIQEEPAE